MCRKDIRRVIAFESLEERHALSGFAAHFDFGTATSPVAQNFTRVSDRTTYSPAQGYGWTAGKILSGDRGGKHSLLNYQRSSNTIRALLPSNYDPTESYRVVYVLPVEKGNGRQFGDGLVTARNLGLQNTYDAIFVAPTFSDNPWYADHVSNSQIWQETYFRKVVVPFVEDQYGIDARPENRLLLGFSKSGYGAVSMLLRFPETFGRAVTFDSPLTLSDPKAVFGFLDVLGSRQNFTQNYQVTSLIANRGSALTGTTPRIILMGYSNSYPYYRDHASISAQLTRLSIPHIHATGVLRSHVWHSGWMADAAKNLLT